MIVSVSVSETARPANRISMLMQFVKKALLSAFFIACHSQGLAAQTANPFCSDASKIETGVVYRVVDGDTIVLANKRRIRLLGINTPEVNFKKPEQSEAFSIEARARLKELLPEKSEVQLYYDDRHKDRYKRDLARVVVNGLDVGEQLLREGLARQYLILPNQRCWKAYYEAELQARTKDSGIWKSEVKFVPAKKLQLRDKKREYVFTRGTVTRFEHSSNNFWFILDEHLYLGVSKKDQNQFQSSHPNNLESIKVGEQLLVRGWLYKSYDKLRIKIRHPQEIEVKRPQS